MNEKLKDYYMRAFSDDEMGEELNPGVTFNDLFYALDCRRSVYHLMGLNDSVIRERLFARLAFLIGMDYDYVYDQWLLA